MVPMTLDGLARGDEGVAMKRMTQIFGAARPVLTSAFLLGLCGDAVLSRCRFTVL